MSQKIESYIILSQIGQNSPIK